MFLLHEFPDSEVNLTLRAFVRMVRDFFRERLVSVVLHGSIAFDDLAPGYGDLDFVAIVEGNLSESDCLQLVELRQPLRSGEYGVLGTMIEGAFLPRHMLDPANSGKAFWWGTTGERRWQRSELGWLVLQVIRERGILIWGEDIRREIPVPRHDALLDEVRMACQSIRQHAGGGGLHSVDWLLTVARLLLWLKEGRLSSKSEAADWGHHHAKGDWRKLLPRAKQIRLTPALADAADTKRWLDELTAPIREAWEELENELSKRTSQQAER